MTDRKKSKRKFVILGVLAFLVCAFLVFFISDYLEMKEAQERLSAYRELTQEQEETAQESAQQGGQTEDAAQSSTAESPSPAPAQSAQSTSGADTAEAPADSADTAEAPADGAGSTSQPAQSGEQSSGQTAAPAAPKEKQMPAEMREFDNAEDYAEACFYDYYDLVVAESMDPNSPLYGMDDTTLIKIAYDDAYDDWYRYH